MDPYARYQYAKEAPRTDLVRRSEGYFITEEAMQEGNPQRILDRREAVQLPSTLVVQGTADTNIPIALTRHFVDTFRAAGGQIEIEEFPDMPHAFANRPGPESDRAIELMKAFIARQLAARPAQMQEPSHA
jgi:dipeptidyl aminopeptidase/acylaminoacyl peptidase